MATIADKAMIFACLPTRHRWGLHPVAALSCSPLCCSLNRSFRAEDQPCIRNVRLKSLDCLPPRPCCRAWGRNWDNSDRADGDPARTAVSGAGGIEPAGICDCPQVRGERCGAGVELLTVVLAFAAGASGGSLFGKMKHRSVVI